MKNKPIVELGDWDGKIVVYLNESSAIDMAQCFSYNDSFYGELMDAVEKAYPKEDKVEREK